MKTTKVLAAFLSAAMVITSAAVPVLAEDGETTVHSYQELHDAILATWNKGYTKDNPAVINIDGTIEIDQQISISTGEDVHVKLTGGTLKKCFDGRMFFLQSTDTNTYYKTLTLENITLDGNGHTGYLIESQRAGVIINDGTVLENNRGSAIYAWSSNDQIPASLTIKGGKITNNTVDDSYGGAVYLQGNTSFTMTGGELSGNTAKRGGGIYDGRDSKYYKGNKTEITGGSISGNTATEDNGGNVYMQYRNDFIVGGSANISATTATPNSRFCLFPQSLKIRSV